MPIPAASRRTWPMVKDVSKQAEADNRAQLDQRRAALASFMKKNNLSPQTWAKKAGISPTTLYNYLAGMTASLTLNTIDLLATAANATIFDLIGEGHDDGLAIDTIKLFVKGTVGGDGNYSAGWLPKTEWILITLPDTWNWLFPGDDINPAKTALERPFISFWRPLGEAAPKSARTINQVADEIGVPVHVLRFWETQFPQLQINKRWFGGRSYTPPDIGLLRAIRAMLYDEGGTIKSVQEALNDGLVRPLSLPTAEPFALIASGDSSDLTFPAGSLLVCEEIGINEPLNNQHVIIEDGAAGSAEAIINVRLFRIIDGDFWLWPESSNPQFQSPIKFDPQNKASRIVATVYASYRPEIIR